MPRRNLALGSVISATLLIAACGGEDYSTPFAAPGDPPTPLFEPTSPSTGTESKDTDSPEIAGPPIKPGYYKTSEYIENGNTYRDIATIIDSAGNFVTIVSDTEATFGVLAGTESNEIVGAGTKIFLSDNWQQIDGNLLGQASDQENATLTMSAPDAGYQSSLELSRNNIISDVPIDLTEISGTYMMQNPDFVTASITISPDGTVIGSDERGCIFNGVLNIPDNTVNAFQVVFTAENCASIGGSSSDKLNGEYAALGVFFRDGLGDALQIVGTNGDAIAYFDGIK